MTFIQYFAAALVIIGSGLVLRAVWLFDLDAPVSVPQPDSREEMVPAEALSDDWRQAA